jgi:SAM-dependent methyltransferase
MAYRLILGREPENPDVVDRHALPSRSLAELRRAFLTSEEFGIRFKDLHQKIGDSGNKPLVWKPIQVEVDVGHERLMRMVERIEREFKYLGETEPHWSVISAEQFKAENIAGNEAEFFESGKGVVDDLQATAARCGIDLTRYQTCFELGCGLGRSTIWLAEAFPRVIGADISAAHLQMAGKVLKDFNRPNVALKHINTLAALERMEQFDVFFSIIVLQHNPPPLIAYILRTALSKLKPGGIAYFQVPTYSVGYKFDANTYLASEQPPGVPEMHVVPQPVLFRLFDDCSCRMLEVREDGAAGTLSVSNRFLLQRATD